MVHSVELLFDVETDAAVRRIWVMVASSSENVARAITRQYYHNVRCGDIERRAAVVAFAVAGRAGTPGEAALQTRLSRATPATPSNQGFPGTGPSCGRLSHSSPEG